MLPVVRARAVDRSGPRHRRVCAGIPAGAARFPTLPTIQRCHHESPRTLEGQSSSTSRSVRYAATSIPFRANWAEQGAKRQHALAQHDSRERDTRVSGKSAERERCAVHFSVALRTNHFSRRVNRNSCELSAVAGASRGIHASSCRSISASYSDVTPERAVEAPEPVRGRTHAGPAPRKSHDRAIRSERTRASAP